MNDPTFDLIERIEAQFPNHSKNVVYPVKQNKGKCYTIAFVAGRFWIYLSVLIGSRCGIKEQLTVYDSLASIIVDKLLLCTRFDSIHDFGLLKIQELRNRIANLDSLEQERVITEELLVQAKRAEEQPAFFEETIREIHNHLVAGAWPPPIEWNASLGRHEMFSGGSASPR